MIVLKSTQLAMKWSGLHFIYSLEQGWSYQVYSFFAFAMTSSMLQPQLTTLLQALGDLIKATEALVQVCTEVQTIVKIIIFIVQRKLVVHLLRELQQDYNDAERKNYRIGQSIGRKYVQSFGRADRHTAIFTNINVTMLAVAVVVFQSRPLVNLAYHHHMGTLQPEMWTHPFKGVFLFDYLSTPGYVCGYLVNVLYNIFMGLNFTAIDMFFLGLCVYAMAYLDNMQTYFNHLDESYMQNRHNVVAADKELEMALKRGIQMHYKILSQIEKIETLQAGIVFAQFAGVVIILSTITFQVITLEVTEAISYAGASMVLLWQFFLYCFYGTKLTNKSFEVCDAIYQLHWYDYPPKHQRYLGKIMLRLQKPMVLSGYGYVNCNLESFVGVIKMVGSVIAVFQSFDTN